MVGADGLGAASAMAKWHVNSLHVDMLAPLEGEERQSV
jgi:hypothetical protein